MPLYVYRCAASGSAGFTCADFEVPLAMGSAPASLPCPECGAPSPRRFTAPHLSHASSSAYRLIEGTQRSASEPAVVRSPGPASDTRPAGNITTNPLHRKLPRPD